MNGPTNRRLIRRVLTVSVFACLTLIAAAPMASADPCSPLDLSCTLQDTTTTAGQVLDDTTTTVGQVLDDTTATAGQVLDDTTTTVGQVLDDTTATAGQVLDDTTTTVGQVLDDTTATVGGVVGGAPGPVGGGLPAVPPGTGGQPSQGGSDPPADQPVPPGGGSTGGGDDTQVGPSGTATHAEPFGPVVGPRSRRRDIDRARRRCRDQRSDARPIHGRRLGFVAIRRVARADACVPHLADHPRDRLRTRAG